MLFTQHLNLNLQAMAFHNTLGAWGEERAARFLMNKG